MTNKNNLSTPSPKQRLSNQQEEFLLAATSLVTRVGFFIEDIEASEIDKSILPNYEILVGFYNIAIEKLNTIPEDTRP